MSEANNAPVHVRHRLVVAELTSGHARRPVEMVNWIQGASDETGEVAGRVKLNDFAQALANAESAQPAERAGGWVSVEERLPRDAEAVLARVEGDLPAVGFYRSYDKPLHWATGWWSRNGHALAGVTHWMPLPPPPQPKEKP